MDSLSVFMSVLMSLNCFCTSSGLSVLLDASSARAGAAASMAARRAFKPMSFQVRVMRLSPRSKNGGAGRLSALVAIEIRTGVGSKQDNFGAGRITWRGIICQECANAQEEE